MAVKKQMIAPIRRSDEVMVYIGPEIPRIVAANSAFRNGPTPKFLEVMEQHPVIRALLVPSKKLAESRKEVKTKGSALNLAYQEVVHVVRGDN